MNDKMFFTELYTKLEDMTQAYMKVWDCLIVIRKDCPEQLDSCGPIQDRLSECLADFRSDIGWWVINQLKKSGHLIHREE